MVSNTIGPRISSQAPAAWATMDELLGAALPFVVTVAQYYLFALLLDRFFHRK